VRLNYNSGVSAGDNTKKHEAIYSVVREVPKGSVATYGQVAMLAGFPRHARLAGYALFNLPARYSGIAEGPKGLELISPLPRRTVPWWRVINAQGRISYSDARGGHDHLQRTLLEAEGVEFSPAGRVSLRRFIWHPS
jgi:methylated-DNA-protein-cysteine methyltransferase-like protein